MSPSIRMEGYSSLSMREDDIAEFARRCQTLVEDSELHSVARLLSAFFERERDPLLKFLYAGSPDATG